MKITRRQLAMTAAGAVGVTALAQNPALSQNPPVAAPDWDRVAREAHLQSAQALAKVDVAMLVEPAFQFRA
jgi:hypothetical protein